MHSATDNDAQATRASVQNKNKTTMIQVPTTINHKPGANHHKPSTMPTMALMNTAARSRHTCCLHETRYGSNERKN